jgi:hypothetical protein
MHSKTDILNWKQKTGALFMTLFLMFSTHGWAQKTGEISLSVYPGFTVVNFQQALGYSDDNMEDWSQFYYSAALRVFLSSGKQVKLGAEFAWQQLYYAYYIIPFGASPAYREFNVATTSVMVLGRYSASNFFAVGGAGLHFFDNGVSPSICLEAGYRFIASPKLHFPVSFRVNPVFGSGTPIPISVGAGVSLVL